MTESYVNKPTPDLQQLQVKHRSRTAQSWHEFKRNKLALFGLAIIIVLILLAIFASFIVPYDPVAMNPREALQGPTPQHIFGTDQFGRDLLSRVIYGTRISLTVGIISVSISLIFGIFLGLVSGFYLGVADMIVSRIMDVLYAFPTLLLALVLVATLGQGIDRVMIAIGMVYTPLFARVCRGAVLVERNQMYVESARMIGTRDLGIIFKHILPNALAPLIVQASLCMSYAILAEAALSFLGLGTQPPTPSWGVMLSKGKDLMNYSPWLSIWPGLAIMITVFGFNVLGDGLRDALDPRLREV